MPRENRKRGKKHKKPAEEEYPQRPAQHHEPEAQSEPGPSWIVSAPTTDEFNEEAPFGYVDSEVKAYFRTVDVQIKEWQEEPAQVSEDGEGDPNEDRRLFFVAALSEMSGKEKELATDPDCSTILERMAYSMDDFARRVFMDRLTGSYKTLVKHRFASHVCQTFLDVAGETITRETRGILPPPPEDTEAGELPLMSDMVSDICEELLPDFTDLLMDPFASHVCRALLALLVPNIFPTEQRASVLRSKKSAAYKARQGTMKSLFNEKSEASKDVPPKFASLAEQLMKSVSSKLSANEVRALAASSVACPVLKMLLEIEAVYNLSDQPDSLADRVLDGLITQSGEGQSDNIEASDYVGTLLRDPTSSHLLETLVRRLPTGPFDLVWNVYLKTKLTRLSVHPVANFVVGKALERVNGQQLAEACDELSPVAEKMFSQARTGIVRALVDRVASLPAEEQSCIPTIIEMIRTGLGLSGGTEDQPFFVPCVLRLLSKEVYQKAKAEQASKTEEKEDAPNRRYHREPTVNPMAPKTQGALILQSLLHLPTPHNQVVLDSIFSLPMDEIIAMSHDVTSSRVYDVLLTSPTVSFKEKRRFVMHFIGHYHELVDDRIGSRVGDNCWVFADPYLKEKIARSVIPNERTLVGSFYGKFFARNLNLHLLQRNPAQWKNLQANKKMATTPAVQPENQTGQAPTDAQSKEEDIETEQADNKRKRKARPADEIDELFEAKLGKKVKKAELSTMPIKAEQHSEGDTKKEKKHRKDKGETEDKGLDAVLGAIKAAPKEEKQRHKKKTS